MSDLRGILAYVALQPSGLECHLLVSHHKSIKTYLESADQVIHTYNMHYLEMPAVVAANFIHPFSGNVSN